MIHQTAASDWALVQLVHGWFPQGNISSAAVAAADRQPSSMSCLLGVLLSLRRGEVENGQDPVEAWSHGSYIREWHVGNTVVYTLMQE